MLDTSASVVKRLCSHDSCATCQTCHLRHFYTFLAEKQVAFGCMCGMCTCPCLVLSNFLAAKAHVSEHVSRLGQRKPPCHPPHKTFRASGALNVATAGAVFGPFGPCLKRPWRPSRPQEWHPPAMGVITCQTSCRHQHCSIAVTKCHQWIPHPTSIHQPHWKNIEKRYESFTALQKQNPVGHLG